MPHGGKAPLVRRGGRLQHPIGADLHAAVSQPGQEQPEITLDLHSRSLPLSVAKIPIGWGWLLWRKRNVVRSRQTGSIRRCHGKTDPCQGGRLSEPRGPFRGAARTLTSTASDALACTPRIGPATAEVLRTARAKRWPACKDLSAFGPRSCTIWTPPCQEHSARCRLSGEP